MLLYVLLPFAMLKPGSTSDKNGDFFEETYFLVKLLFTSLDVLHLHSFLTHDGTERRLITFITIPCLGDKIAKEKTQYTVPDLAAD